MTGNDVFKYAVKALDSVVEETLEANGLEMRGQLPVGIAAMGGLVLLLVRHFGECFL